MQECLENAADITIEIKLYEEMEEKYETEHEQHMHANPAGQNRLKMLLLKFSITNL